LLSGLTTKYFIRAFVATSYFCNMKKCLHIFSILALFILTSIAATAQCAMCTKTAQQLGEKPAQGLNSGILYLMVAPFAIVGYIGFRWWKNRIPAEEETAGNP